MIQGDVTRTMDWLRGHAVEYKDVLTGYLPSFGAGGAGVLFGFLRK